MNIDDMNKDYQLRVAINLSANFTNCTLDQLDAMAIMANCALKQLRIEAREESKRTKTRFMDTEAGKEYHLVNEYCTMINRRHFYMLDQIPPRNITKRGEHWEQVTKPLWEHCEEIARNATK